MKLFKWTLLVAMLLSLSLATKAQLPQQGQSEPKQLDPDRFETIHSQLVKPEDKAGDVNRLTQEVAPVLPGAPDFSIVARKNFVDEFIFGRMERDKIPHAPVAGDAEFLRRAYLDATGSLADIRSSSFLPGRQGSRQARQIDRRSDWL